jgi:hypothetical protein
MIQRIMGLPQGTDRLRGYGKPFPRPSCSLGAAGVHHGDLAAFVHHALGDLAGAHGWAVVGLIGACAHEEEELGVARVCLPIELAAIGEFPFDKLVAHGLAGEVERPLADGGVPVGIGGAETIAEKAADELAASTLLASPVVANLIVFGAEVRVLGIDKILEVVGMLGLEFFQGHLFGSHILGILGQGLVDRRIPQGGQIGNALHVPFAKKVSSEDDLLDGLVEGDADPFVFSALACALEDFDDAVGVVEGLDARKSLGAQRGIHGGGLGQGRGIGI